jgi:ABC-type glycerol-3-phosphate transport system permease component
MPLVARAALHTVLAVLSVFYLLPLVWAVSTSLKTEAQVSFQPETNPRELAAYFIPRPVVWSNYTEALTQENVPFHFFFANSILITTYCLIGGLFSASLVAYGFAMHRFPGRDALFYAMLGTMMVPGVVTMIPSFILFRELGWINTPLPLIVPSFFGGGAFAIFLFRQFFLTLPRELIDAGKIDGCSPFGVYWHIVMPLSKPVLATLAIFTFLGVWNDFMGPLVYLHDMKRRTVALGLYSFQGVYYTNWPYLMAASIVALVPVLAVFLACQRYFVRGIQLSGIKG